MSFYKKIMEAVGKLTKLLIVITFIGMSLSVFIQIVLRFFFSTTILQLEDIAKYCFSWLIFIGAASVFDKDGHVSVTFFIKYMPDKLASTLDFLQRILVMIYSAFIVIKGWQFVANGMWEISMQLKIPVGYFYIAVPLCGLLTILFQINFISKQRDIDEIKESIVSSV